MKKSAKSYTTSRKKRLAEKIGKITSKRDIVNIHDIITENEDVNITENKNGMHLLFHKYKDETYRKLDKFLHKINKKRKYFVDSENIPTENMVYKAYAKDKYPSQKNFSPKLKYSNKEKNIINRRIYNKNINQDVDSDILYTEYSLENLSDP